MTTRADQRRPYESRQEIQGKASGASGEVAGNQGEMVLRDVASAMGYLPTKVTEENLALVVTGLLEILQGPVARDILEVGRFVNRDSEITRLSETLIRRLEARFDERYSPI